MSALKSKFWVDALIRRAELGLAAIYVIRRGDEDAGAVLVKVVSGPSLAQLYVPSRDEEGSRIWTCRRETDEAELDAWCRKRFDQDPDLWLIEIEDRQGRHFLTEPVDNP
ncbi:hypothetical protein AWH62_10735 [Maricaulis sp. W15]|uniref:DUF1491 family protein n=1 Tax=Maricaulis sp. W15 TaxID=1772333 RepID=UPI000948B11F|nr:DUF1491 family protein [Maricaulis sp. W15]OLF72303.1 hypothetical protein AWH62_10735 [Maricaulis sp. W15]